MRINSLVKMLFAMPMLLAATLFTSCDTTGDDVVTPPTVGVTKGTIGETTLTFTVTAIDAERLAYVVLTASEIAPDAEAIIANGVALPVSQREPVKVENLEPATTYCIIAAASNKGGTVKSEPVVMTTLEAELPVDEIEFNIVAGETAEFEAEGGNGEIEFEISYPVYPIESLEATCVAEWVKDIELVVAESKVTYTVEANTKAESRSAKIVLTYADITREVAISQKPHIEENKPALSLKSEATVKFTAEGGNGTIKYELINPAEGTELEATCEAEWVSNVAVDATNSEVTFAVAANETYEARNAKVKVAYGELSFDVAVEQAAAEKPAEPELTLKGEATKEFAAEGGNGEFAYELKNAVEGTELVATCEAQWVSNVTVDEANSKVTYTVAANEAEEAREAQVVLAYGELEVKVTVKQAAFVSEEGDYTLTITSESVKRFEAVGGSGEINYTIENPSDNISLSVTTKDNVDWITIGAVTDNSVSYTIAENTSEEERRTYIVLTYGSVYERVRIIQNGVEPEVTTQEVEFTTAELFKKEGGGIFTIEFSNADNQTLYVPFNSSVNDYLAAGTYSAGMSDNEFVYPTTYMIVGGNEYAYNDEGLNAKDVNTIVVELAADNTYTFTFNNLTFGKEYIASGSWSGKIEGLGIFEENEEFEPTHIANECMWGGYSSISWGNYYNVQGENFSLQLHFCTDVALENSIAAGKYEWFTNSAITNSNPERFSTRSFTVNGNTVAVDSGKATVKVNGEEYTINLTLDGRDGNTYCIQYVGKLNVKYVAPDDGGNEGGDEGGEGGEDDGNDDGDPNTITLNTFVYNSDLRGNYLGYLFKATAENVELGICIGSQSCSKTSINAGDYTYNQYPEDLAYAFQLRGSKINGTDVSNDPNATMNVAVNDGVYTITIVTNGYTLTYNGTL